MEKRKNKSDQMVEMRLAAMSVDYFLLENHKNISKENNITILKENFEVDIELKVTTAVVIEQNITQIILNVKIFTKEKHIYLCEITTVFDYNIKGLDNFFNKKENKFDIPEPIMITLIATCYSTTRGLLYSKLAGTFLPSFILPLIDPRQGLLNK